MLVYMMKKVNYYKSAQLSCSYSPGFLCKKRVNYDLNNDINVLVVVQILIFK